MHLSWRSLHALMWAPWRRLSCPVSSPAIGQSMRSYLRRSSSLNGIWHDECHDGSPRESSNSLSREVAAQLPTINASQHTKQSRSWLTPPNTILTGWLGADRSTLSEALPAMPFDRTASLGQGTPDSHYASGVTPGMVINEVAQP